MYGRRWPFVIIVEESGATAAATGGEINEYIKAALWQRDDLWCVVLQSSCPGRLPAGLSWSRADGPGETGKEAEREDRDAWMNPHSLPADPTTRFFASIYTTVRYRRRCLQSRKIVECSKVNMNDDKWCSTV